MVLVKVGCRDIEEIIGNYLEYFALDDALFLAEVYHDIVDNSQSLYLLAQCMLRLGRLENTYNMLQLSNFDATPELRYLYANCCYELQRLQEAETVLRSKDQPLLDAVFVGTNVEPFARSLLSRLFLETGRAEEAKEESQRCLEMNLLSWTNIKTYCSIGNDDIDSISKKLMQCVDAVRNSCKLRAKCSASTLSPIKKLDEKIEKMIGKKSPAAKELQRKMTSHASKKSKAEASIKKGIDASRRRMTDLVGMETRRNTRSYGVSQDSENQSMIGNKDSRTTSRSKLASLSSVGATRSLQDKQLRSMNRINEIEMIRTPLAIPASQNLPEASDSLSEEPVKLLEESQQLQGKEHSVQARAVTSTSVTPLSSHDPNALNTKHQELSAVTPATARSGSCTSSCSSFQQSGVRTHKTHKDSMKQSKTVNIVPFSPKYLQDCGSKLTANLCEVVECVCWLAFLQCALSKYKTKLGLDRYHEMPERFSKMAMACELLARIYFEKHDFVQTGEILEKLHRQKPYRLSGMEILSTALWHTQDSRRLSMLASELTDKARGAAETWCVAGNCFSLQKQHETAVECLERAVLLNPRFIYALSLLGHELLSTEQLDKAAAAFRRALMLSPNDYRAWFGLGLMHYKKEQFALARVHLSKGVAINPWNSVLLCQLSLVEQSLRNNSAAMDLLQRALHIAPDNAACRFFRARLLYEMHEYEMCRDELNELKLLAHDEAQVFFLLGRVYKKLGQTHLALLNFSWATEMDPKGEQSRNILNDAPYDDDPPVVD